ncbi:MAG: ABC transporter ATP-binding protein [Candidatus Lokiarchaeota archaeon]|nr:ABC transporter ATP-binding protein [Candidatus Lokiarchaeota archaeon]
MVKSNRDIIECNNVSKQFGYFFALKKISFNVREHTIFGIAGANGAGKTTLIKILCGLLKPTFGNILVSGMNYEENSNIIKQNIGITTDESFLFEELTIFENLKYYANLHLNFEKKKIKTRIDQLCKKFTLTDWIDEPVRILSHGMKQKVELIRVLIHQPSILFLDEPFSGLDYNATTMLINFFNELKENNNISIILTTHKIDVFQQICDDLIILKRGKINKIIASEEFNETHIKSYF